MVNYPRCSKYLLTMNILLLLFQRKYMYHLLLFPPLPNKLTPIMHLLNMYRFVSRFPKPCVFRLILNIMSTANEDGAQTFKELVLIKNAKSSYIDNSRKKRYTYNRDTFWHSPARHVHHYNNRIFPVEKPG